MEPKRLNKFISDSGFCSRREADKLIEEERVTVNGRLPDPGVKVTPQDKVRIDDQILRVREEAPVFLLFHKPPGMSAKSDPSIRDNVVRAINHPAKLEPIGFLERDSEGLLFLSNDTELGRRITRADTRFEKEYVVTVDKLITQEFISKMMGGNETLSGERTLRTYIEKVGTSRFKIVLMPGTNHNIKMLCENLGYRVVHLQRTRIQQFTLGKLPVGHWRALTPDEVDGLKKIAESRGIPATGSNTRSSEGYAFKGPARRDGDKRSDTSKRFDKSTSVPREGKSRVKPTESESKGGNYKGIRGSSKPGSGNGSNTAKGGRTQGGSLKSGPKRGR